MNTIVAMFWQAINKAIDLSEKNIKDWLLESSSELL
jgi:hypothetical protein